MAEGRMGLGIPVDRFVVAPDDTLSARLGRWQRNANGQMKRMRVRIRRQARSVAAMVRIPFFDESPNSKVQAFLRDALGALRDSAVLIGLILRYAFSRPLHASEAEQQYVRRSRKSVVILALAIVALAFALLLPERERDALTPEPIVTVAEARTPEPVAEPASLEIRRVPEPVLPPEHKPWQPVRQPMALYHLESPELSGLTLNYRVSQRDRSRQDTLIWQPKGEAGETELRRTGALIVLERHEGAAPTEKPLFADLAARAAEHRFVVERMARPQDIRTKFGPVEAAEITLRHEAGATACLAFRRIDMAGITLVGWLCGTAQRPVDRVSMSCFVDRLDLVGGGRDTILRKYFSEAERSRQNCPSARQSGRKLTWMDHEAPVPALKLTARR